MAFIDNMGKETINIATKRTMPDRDSGLRYQNVEENLDTLYRNTGIPDETFGPDEERIFIDVDPYDLDESMFGLQHSVPVKITPVGSKEGPVTSTNSGNDYVEESLKNIKRQWQNTAESKNHWNSTPKDHKRGTLNSVSPSDNVNVEVYYIPDSNTKRDNSMEPHNRGTDRKHHEYSGTEHVSSTVSHSETDDDPKEADQDEKRRTEDEEAEMSNRTDDYGESLEEEMKKRRVFVENDTVEDVKDLEDDLSELALTEQGSTVTEKHQDTGNWSQSQEDRKGSSAEAFDFQERSTKEETRKTNKSDLATASTPGSNVTMDATISSLIVLGENLETASLNLNTVRFLVIKLELFVNRMYNCADTAEDLIFEWVTTDWSKCTQSCGGSGFQVITAVSRECKPLGKFRKIISSIYDAKN